MGRCNRCYGIATLIGITGTDTNSVCPPLTDKDYSRIKTKSNKQVTMAFEDYGIGFINDSIDISGVIAWLIVKYGHPIKEKKSEPYYKRNDLKFKDYGR